MIRKIIQIDEEKCNGCGACASACQEGAIAMVEGKARLMREDYCDGLGNCLPACPTGAITFVERETLPFDEAAAKAAMQASAAHTAGCPGSAARALRPGQSAPAAAPAGGRPSCLAQWPVQIKLVPTQAPWLDGARLLIAADCAAYARASFHEDFMAGCVTLIGCPKLDGVDYTEKLTQILAGNRILSVTVARMEVPCCGGLEMAARQALAKSGKDIPLQVAVLGVDGSLKR